MITTMPIDPRLNKIDDCLYRVAARVLIIQNNRILLVQEFPEMWWALPGGGIDHGETVESALTREVEEELGIPAQKVKSNFQIAHYSIGQVVSGIPRMNLFFKASIPEDSLQQTDHVAKCQWFNKNEFMELNLHSSYDKTKLAEIIFDN